MADKMSQGDPLGQQGVHPDGDEDPAEMPHKDKMARKKTLTVKESAENEAGWFRYPASRWSKPSEE